MWRRILRDAARVHGSAWISADTCPVPVRPDTIMAEGLIEAQKRGIVLKRSGGEIALRGFSAPDGPRPKTVTSVKEIEPMERKNVAEWIRTHAAKTDLVLCDFLPWVVRTRAGVPVDVRESKFDKGSIIVNGTETIDLDRARTEIKVAVVRAKRSAEDVIGLDTRFRSTYWVGNDHPDEFCLGCCDFLILIRIKVSKV